MRNHLLQWGLLGGFFGLMLGLTGCATTRGLDQSARVSVSLKSASQAVQGQIEALETTLSALQMLTEDPTGDLRPPYKRYATELKRLAKSVETTSRTGQEVAEATEQYLAAWEANLASVEFDYIRERSEARRVEVSSFLSAVQQRYAEAQEVVDPLVRYLRDIRIVLSTDLNPEGLANVKPLVANAAENARLVRTALGHLQADLQLFSERLAARVVEKSS